MLAAYDYTVIIERTIVCLLFIDLYYFLLLVCEMSQYYMHYGSNYEENTDLRLNSASGSCGRIP